ncbi:MAG: glycosyl hydrolase, partial [Myxococcota bacterium]
MVVVVALPEAYPRVGQSGPDDYPSPGLIADELGETALVETYRNSLQADLQPWLEGTNGDPLVYDETWGGVVIRAGLTN